MEQKQDPLAPQPDTSGRDSKSRTVSMESILVEGIKKKFIVALRNFFFVIESYIRLKRVA